MKTLSFPDPPVRQKYGIRKRSDHFDQCAPFPPIKTPSSAEKPFISPPFRGTLPTTMSTVAEQVALTTEELQELRKAKWDLEHPSLAIRLTNILGTPIEKGFQMLPAGWTRVVHGSVHSALNRTLQMATLSLSKRPYREPSNRFHRLLVGTSGAVGGLFGLVSLPVELPVSTGLMLRSIADIAQSEGHSLKDVETQMACLEVFALGGRPNEAKGTENRYWIVRAGLARTLTEATTYLANRGVVKETAPAIVRLVTAIAARFSVVVSEQVAAKAIPVVGAASGALINLIFIRHFQRMARGHFVVRRLEKKYGADNVESIYRSIPIPVRKKELGETEIRNI